MTNTGSGVRNGKGSFHCQRVPGARATPTLEEDIRQGLLRSPRTLHPKYFYDERGSILFDKICDTPEYYPTRAEDTLLARHAADIIAPVRPDHIIELGSGTSRKTRHFIEACEKGACPAEYWPFDVCEEILQSAGESLIDAHPWLKINALQGDYTAGLQDFPQPEGRKLWLFLGGTIGNMPHQESVSMLSEIVNQMNRKDALVVGADRRKNRAQLLAAYNDSSGATAAFNLNVLKVINRDLGANFNLEAFRHEARFNEEEHQIEMYLFAQSDQHVIIEAIDESFTIEDGEGILTEISRKFSRSSFEDLFSEAGFKVQEHFELEQPEFSLVLARPSR